MVTATQKSWAGRLFVTMLMVGLAALVTPALSEAAAAEPTVESFVLNEDTADSVSTQASELDQCSLEKFGYTGWGYCETFVSRVTYGDGAQEWFMIGLDWRIWHVWAGAGGWKSLGGWAYHAIGNGVWIRQGPPSPVIIRTIGLDGYGWCRNRYGGGWGGSWYAC